MMLMTPRHMCCSIRMHHLFAHLSSMLYMWHATSEIRTCSSTASAGVWFFFKSVTPGTLHKACALITRHNFLELLKPLALALPVFLQRQRLGNARKSHTTMPCGLSKSQVYQDYTNSTLACVSFISLCILQLIDSPGLLSSLACVSYPSMPFAPLQVTDKPALLNRPLHVCPVLSALSTSADYRYTRAAESTLACVFLNAVYTSTIYRNSRAAVSALACVFHASMPFAPLQVTDTPGLLNRPLAERNAMERLTLACLQHLPSTVLFVLDLTAQCGTSVADQLAIRYRMVDIVPAACDVHMTVFQQM